MSEGGGEERLQLEVFATNANISREQHVEVFITKRRRAGSQHQSGVLQMCSSSINISIDHVFYKRHQFIEMDLSDLTNV